MARTDLSYEELIDYRAAVAEPADFDIFWNDTIAEARSFDLNVRLTPVDTPYRTVEISDASFCGYAGDRINAWLLRPRHEEGPRPAVVEFIGYNGGRVSRAPSCPGRAPATPICSSTRAVKDPSGAAAGLPRIRMEQDRRRPVL